MQWRKAWLWLACGWMACIAHAQDDVPLRIEGVSGDVRANLEAYVGKLTAEDLRNWRETLPRLRTAAREAMQAVGYYRADVRFSRPDERQVLLQITPGEPVIVRSLKLRFQGEAGNDIAFTALLDTLPMREGDIFHHGRYEAIKTQVQDLALERGYFAGKWVDHAVNVLEPEQVADITLIYDSGKRYTFGPVSFRNAAEGKPLPIREELLQRLVPFSEDAPYEAGKVIEFNKALLDSRYFSDVRVRADAGMAVDNAIPVGVTVASGKRNQVDLGAGYATDVGPRLSLDWRRPLLNDGGHSIETTSELSPVRQTVDLKYSIPWTHPLNDTLQLFSGFKREELDTQVTYNTTLGVERLKRRPSGWQTSYSLRYSRESYSKTSGEKGSSVLLLPGVSLSRTRSRGGTDPYWGDRQYYQAEFASPQLLSDADLISLRVGWRLLRTLADRHQFLLRADGGAILTNDFDSVPLNMRFYAGGDQSVRGYDYQSLSPRDSNGLITGARNLVTFSGEYGYKFAARWRAAAFVDEGNAFNAVNEGLKTGAGIGIRWISPVGPIRLDLAWGLSGQNASPRIHFFMGPAL